MKYSKTHPIFLTLFPNQSTHGDYSEKISWEISLGDREPPTLLITTDFHLKTKSLSLFPIYTFDEKVIYKPNEFFSQPVVLRNYPDIFLIKYSPIQGLNVETYYWVPDSYTLRCLVNITNSTLSAINLSVGFAVQLNPLEGGFRMKESTNQQMKHLWGASGSMYFAFGTKGSIIPGVTPYPSLDCQLRIDAGGTRTIPWVLSAGQSEQSSLRNLQENLKLAPWQEEMAAAENAYSDIIKIETGNSEWDITFEQSQKYFPVLIQNNIIPVMENSLPKKIKAETTTQKDTDNNISIYELFYLIYNYHTPFRDIALKLLGYIIETAHQCNAIPCTYPITNTDYVYPAPPIMAKLVKKLYTHKAIPDAILDQLIPHIIKNIEYWVNKIKSGSGSWDSQDQIGLDITYYPPSDPRYIKNFNSPALIAMLYTDIIALQSFRHHANKQQRISDLMKHLDFLQRQLLQHWSPKDSSFHYSDSKSTIIPENTLLFKGVASHPIKLNHPLSPPNRIIVRISLNKFEPIKLYATIYGLNKDGKTRTEKLMVDQINPLHESVYLISNELYSLVEQVTIKGIENSHVEICALDYTMHDISQFLTLQARSILSKEINTYIKNNLTNPESFWHQYGITSMDKSFFNYNQFNYVDLIYNNLVLESLLSCNETQTASELFTKLMNAITLNLSSSHKIYKRFIAETGQGIGTPNSPLGLPPLGWFLDLIGINFIDEKTIDIYGKNLFPWDITINYRGTKISKHKSHAKVLFPGGQTVLIKSPKRKRVRLD